MKNMTDKDIADLIKKSEFANPTHKNKLRRQLFEQVSELSLDDLDAVAGGLTWPNSEKQDTFPSSEDDKK